MVVLIFYIIIIIVIYRNVHKYWLKCLKFCKPFTGFSFEFFGAFWFPYKTKWILKKIIIDHLKNTSFFALVDTFIIKVAISKNISSNVFVQLDISYFFSYWTLHLAKHYPMSKGKIFHFKTPNALPKRSSRKRDTSLLRFFWLFSLNSFILSSQPDRSPWSY